MDSIRNYLGEKEFRVSEILQFSIMLLLSGFLIGGGIIILNDEDIFKKIYEGYQSPPAVSNTWTADLPDDLLLVNLQKNVKLIRKNSLINTITAWTMIVLGSIISIYQIYNLFFS
jgi:Mn2+/Fe2+ NRAMP family transporter